jgi:hypothetical protein
MRWVRGTGEFGVSFVSCAGGGRAIARVVRAQCGPRCVGPPSRAGDSRISRRGCQQKSTHDAARHSFGAALVALAGRCLRCKRTIGTTNPPLSSNERSTAVCLERATLDMIQSRHRTRYGCLECATSGRQSTKLGRLHRTYDVSTYVRKLPCYNGRPKAKKLSPNVHRMVVMRFDSDSKSLRDSRLTVSLSTAPLATHLVHVMIVVSVSRLPMKAPTRPTSQPP